MKNFSGVRGLSLIVYKSLKQHSLSTIITILSIALAAGLVMAIFNIRSQTHTAFTGGVIGYDAVLGARGSQLQLVLNSVFHLETSPGNIPWTLYRKIKEDPRVKLAIPYAVGDNYKGYRIVGTTEEIYTKFHYQKNKKLELNAGNLFQSNKRELVLGSFVAENLNLSVGSSLKAFHGLSYSENMKPHDESYQVVGILEPTNTPIDRVIWTHIDSVYRMGGHILRGDGRNFEAHTGQEIPDEHKEVSAVMLNFRSPQDGFFLNQMVNKQGKVATLAWPISKVMADLMAKIGWMTDVLKLMAYLVIFVAVGSILASIYNTINERRREFAIFRALGANKTTLFLIIVTESALISLLGALIGYFVYGIIFSVADSIIRSQTGVVLDLFKPHIVLLLTPIGMALIGALAGIIPAIRAYSTDVATNLMNHS